MKSLTDEPQEENQTVPTGEISREGRCQWVWGMEFMWTVIYIAPSQKQAELIRHRLNEQGFMVKIQPSRISKQQFEILIPHGEVDEVQEILSDVLQIGRE